MTYIDILNRDVPRITALSRACAIAGNVAPIRLYYKFEAIAGVASFDTVWCGDGWIYSGIDIPPSVPYSRYWQFIYERFGNVPLFAEVAQ